MYTEGELAGVYREREIGLEGGTCNVRPLYLSDNTRQFSILDTGLGEAQHRLLIIDLLPPEKKLFFPTLESKECSRITV